MNKLEIYLVLKMFHFMHSDIITGQKRGTGKRFPVWKGGVPDTLRIVCIHIAENETT